MNSNPDSHLVTMMDRAVTGLDAPTERLVRGGLERGRVLRRRRRAIQAGTGTALVGLIAAVVVSIVPGGGPASGGQGAPDQRNSAAHQPPAQVHRATAPAPVSISPQLLAKTAIGLLPRKGRITDLHGRSMAGDVLAEFVYDDGHGAAQINVSMAFRQDGTDAVDDSCDASDPVYTEVCTHRSDGSHLGTFVASTGTTQYSVYVVRPDHVQVSMTAFNAPQEKDVAPTRATPPFTLHELTTIVTDPSWTPWVTQADDDAVANLFVPDYTYDHTAQARIRRVERLRAAQAEERAKAAAERARAEHRKRGH